MRVALGTLAAGRPDHLARQAAAVSRLGVHRYVVISMQDEPPDVAGATVVQLPDDDRGGLPLAAARNLALAKMADADLAIMLDVDCIPGTRLVSRYVAGARAVRRPCLLCGPVGYLDPLGPDASGPTAAERRRARARVIRTFPTTGHAREPRHELFWSLSFAVAPSVHERIGGFDEGFRGWGAEDTDYGLRAQRDDVGLWLIAGAWSYHQHHPPTLVHDLENVAANARRFHRRWGRWPMPDQLARFAAQGRLEWDPDGDRCAVRYQLRTSFL